MGMTGKRGDAEALRIWAVLALKRARMRAKRAGKGRELAEWLAKEERKLAETTKVRVTDPWWLRVGKDRIVES